MNAKSKQIKKSSSRKSGNESFNSSLHHKKVLLSTLIFSELQLAAAWGLLNHSTSSLTAKRPTGASQAQSPCEDDAGDGRANELLASCPAFRNELGGEPLRHVALSRPMAGGSLPPLESLDSWQLEPAAAEIGVLEVCLILIFLSINYFI